MKSAILALYACCVLTSAFVTPLMAAPSEIARESFDGAGGAIGFTTSITQFDEPTLAFNDYFSVQPNNGTKTVGGTISGGDGANMFAAEDIDTAPNNNAATQSITFNAVNIAGKTSTSVKILLSAPGNGPSQGFYDWSATATDIDFIRVEASVDGGSFNRLAQFSPSTNTLNQALSLDTDGDGLGGQGTTLTAAFQDFDLSFPTGNSVQVRVVMHSNATSEYLCIDNVRIFGDTPATSPPVLGNVPGTTLVFAEGGAAAALAPAITVTDSDSANLASATVAITQNLTSTEDVLAATPSGAILAGDIVYTAGTGTLTITGSATKANYETVLRSVTYQNTNVVAPNTALRDITFSANDGTNGSNSPSRQVQVVDSINTHNLPFTESFETDGRGTRYALDGRFTNGNAMFDRGQPSGTNNLDGTFAIIAEDTLLEGLSDKTVRFLLNTGALSGVQATVRLGALGGAIYDTGDTIAIEASVDGGAFSIIGVFRSTAGGSSPMALDTDNNGTGDGTQLSDTLQDFTFTMPAATTLGLRVRCQSNTAGERLIVDRIVVTAPPTYKLSGLIRTSSLVPIEGVTVARTGSAVTVQTDASGFYQFTGVPSGLYTVTPTKTNFTFSPASQGLSITNADRAANFVGAATNSHKIIGRVSDSGGVALANVTVGIAPVGPGVPASVTTNNAGYFTFNGVLDGTYTVTPSKAWTTFAPANRTVIVNGADSTGNNFIGSTGFKIIGRIATSASVAISNVSVALSVAPAGVTSPVFTNSAGYYTFNNVPNGSYTVTPTKAGVTFAPTDRTPTVNNADVTGQNFTGS